MPKDTGKVTYDALKRLTKKTYPDNTTETHKSCTKRSVRKRPGRGKVLAEVLVIIGQDVHGKPAAKIVFVCDRSSKNWLALLSTDTTLTAEEIIALYGRR